MDGNQRFNIHAIDLVECLLVPFEAEAPQPISEVHDGVLTVASVMIIQAKGPVQADALGSDRFESGIAQSAIFFALKTGPLQTDKI